MAKRRSLRIGKIQPPMSVTSPKNIKDLEGLLSLSLTLVLVEAPWCGHCQNFKKNMWSKIQSIPNRSMNTASVQYDMLDKTSLANAKIDGYPSLLLVGSDKKPATFKNDMGEETHAMPTPKTVQEFTQMLQTPIEEPVKNANTVAKTVVTNMSSPVAMESPIASVAPATAIAPAMAPAMASPMANMNSFKPISPDELENPPDTLTDVVESQTRPVEQKQMGGNLLASLMHITKEAAPAGILLASAAYMSKRRSRKNKKNKKKSTRRR